MPSLVTKTVNYIRDRSLNHHQFSQLLEDADNQFTDVPFYTDVRWLSCHKVLKRFYLLRQEIITFFEMKGRNTDEMKDESWLAWTSGRIPTKWSLSLPPGGETVGCHMTRVLDSAGSTLVEWGRQQQQQQHESWLQYLAFAEDFTAQLNDHSLKLQGKYKLITQLYDDVKYFITKLSLWKITSLK